MKQSIFSRKQTGSVGDVVIGILLVMALMTVTHRFMSADPAEVQKVVQSAAKNPDANAVVIAILKEHPVPDNAQLTAMKNKVDEIVMLQTAREVTGDPTLKSAEQVRSEQAAIPKAPVEPTPLDKLLEATLYLIGLTVFVLLSFKAFRAIDARKKGYH